MQRHLSTGSHVLAALMRSDRSIATAEHRADPLHDVVLMLAQQDGDEPVELRPN